MCLTGLVAVQFRDDAMSRIIHDKHHPSHAAVHSFFQCLALCHTVVVDKPEADEPSTPTRHSPYKPPSVGGSSKREHAATEDLVYQAESPDEGALTQVCGGERVLHWQDAVPLPQLTLCWCAWLLTGGS